MSKDSGCVSGKLSSSNSSSEISDCASEGNKLDTQSSETELSWIDGRAYVALDSTREEMNDDNTRSRTSPDNVNIHSGAGGSFPSTTSLDVMSASVGAFSDQTEEIMMGDTTEDLVREVDDLRSENEYLKDEMEEMRCEMLEVRDMFQEEEVYLMQELRLQLEQANKMCRILQYRLRKAERRSIRVAQTGQVDGELVQTLEHDIKVAKSVSVRLHNELESVQERGVQLEWENEVLRERMQELEVARQVLQAEMEKARECSLKRKSLRSSLGKSDKKLSPQDDSADLKCQLHFAKEESALMCKKLTKLVSESDVMREQLAKYHAAYGDIETTNHQPEGSSARSREAEVKVHLRLVEEEATLLSRRIVELEVENRGLRAEMSVLQERGGGREEEEDLQQLGVLNLSTQVTDIGDREQGLKTKYFQCEEDPQAQEENEGRLSECSQLRHVNQLQVEGMFPASQITREGPVGGEGDPKENDNKTGDQLINALCMKDQESLLALRDQACIVSSALRLLSTPSKNGHCSPPSSPHIPQTEGDPQGKTPPRPVELLRQGHLNGALELLNTTLMALVERVETLVTPGGGQPDGSSLYKDPTGWDCSSSLPGESPAMLEAVEELRTVEVKERAKKVTQGASYRWSSQSQNGTDPIVDLSFHLLCVLNQWCLVKGPGPVCKEVRDKTVLALRELMQELGKELVVESTYDWESKQKQGKISECRSNAFFENGTEGMDRTYNSKRNKHISPFRSITRNWYYLSHDAAQMDHGDPFFKTWDHAIMPLSFPDLDLDQMFMERNHTAPEKTALRIYYSPPSARRVQLAQLKQSPVTDHRDSSSTVSPWCTPPSSLSPLCLRMSANLSDDMKEMTAGLRPTLIGRVGDGWSVDMTSSGTQTQPQVVSVGLQTDGPPSSAPGVRNSPTRTLHASSLTSSRSHHLSSSMERVPSRNERLKPASTSPKLSRRYSASASSLTSSSFPSSTTTNFASTSSSSSLSTSSKERALCNLSQRSSAGSTFARPANTKAGPGGLAQSSSSHSDLSNSGRNAKPPSKPSGNNRCGMVTEFLRRVSGRADKPVPEVGMKGKSSPKNLERIPARTPSAMLHRSDSVTRIVNQRFMKQRDEAGRGQREEKGSSLAGSERIISRDQSLSTITSEEGNYGCSSSGTLTFCFARSSRAGQQTTSNQGKLHRNGLSPVVSKAGYPDCE
ncbi:uncharacterized protein FYW47_002347 [Aplochiton taeniatus]